ncbi:hypothetical protein FSP39_009272 [Pinctada imbricata]|uniref:THAP-type domain-containing protein n=1 Tax=Pinctada imbricata TaxID=66713 RepID=A0AA89C302_PINIB|nr:hypothetical protein FSP39_009272 [Pinctada imbricata]
MSHRNCCITGCANSGYRLKIWKSKICVLHESNYGTLPCICKPPFQLYKFPSEDSLLERQAWVKAVNRMDIQNPNKIWTPNNDSRVCSVHFIDGKPSEHNPYPTIDLGHNVKPTTPRKPPKSRAPITMNSNLKPAKKPKHDLQPTFDQSLDISLSESSPSPIKDPINTQKCPGVATCSGIHNHCVISDHNYGYNSTPDLCSVCISKDMQIKLLKDQVSKLTRELKITKEQYDYKVKHPFTVNDIKTDESMKFYTGIRCISGFKKLVLVIKPSLTKLRYWNGPRFQCNPLKHKYMNKKKGPQRRLSCEDELLLSLMKIRLGLLNKDLAQRFGISEQHVSNIFTTWVKVLSKTLGSLVINPPKHVVKKNLPPSFMNPTYKSVRHIIDCTEIFLETPNNLSVRAHTWSDYKHHNTAKYLVSINPSGLINYVSKGWGGRTSDKHITVNSDFLDHVEPNDKVLANRGFPIKEDLILCHAELLIPPGRRGTGQFTREEVNKTKEIANRRIYVEQAIRRMKCFRLLKQELPITLLHHLDDIVRIVAGLCNLYPPLPRYN